MEKKLIIPGAVGWLIGISALILFASSSVRHLLFQSTAWDLGIFDQAVYLISQGEKPVSSFLGFHILGDHAALVFYPLAVLYKIFPSVYWLFAVQAFALAIGSLPIWYLARLAGLSNNLGVAIATAYLLYPLIFNINLFDFHPDVIALPALLAAVLAAKTKQIWWFCASLVLVFLCKEVLSLTVIALGVWLLVFEKRRLYGAIAIITGIIWFMITTKGIIPYFGGTAASVERHISRYSYLGHSFPEIFQNLLFHPELIFNKVFSVDNLFYLVLLLAPVIWGFSLSGITPLIGAVPTLALNLLADDPLQKDLIHQYSLPAIPFLFLIVIQSLAVGKGWLKHKRNIILWALVAFLALAKFGYFWSRYLIPIDTWQATRDAIAQVQKKGSVYTTAEISPHLSQRKFINLTDAHSPPIDLNTFDYVLLNVRHPGWASSQEFATSLVNQLKNQQSFKPSYQRDDVYLFVKK
ncbi:DUF2079 domain-containing protein [Aetokthonos hydrillicola Thurmond2011]|jgi:uncharacterized membrane protein|uniref:DUF2079 domain-containing protein n=1 Tax=Aetokthonos hydrillicola Thurmond2011 TaxID=2712845 RepID=A0AAP5I4A3_9CYAN|nr:DUF2079 domain-containing protein [Aetokthonos hydrillicola]MBO3462163.1 DUF2079 domain-containing protein [Aetokthonos hydrillicola CCALA 1050]MBW4587833.1 DUF2079 domain-containing protein [Aetokthonos hydrillicola CCALA 1050]MDR9894481.1 DUF2079 domain-containing protein [Aetokthonos hydrillicola Thurmond2011]